MSKKITLILLSLLLIGSAYGQKDFRNGFIITLDNDTIQGSVNYRSNAKNYKSCIFKSVDKEKEYYPNQILGFGYNNDKFFSAKLIEGSFVEVLVTGKISLFKVGFKHFLVKKDTSLYKLESIIEEYQTDGGIAKRENSKWRGTLTYLISDCFKNASGLTARIKLDDGSLTRLSLKYNNCTGDSYVEYKANKPWTKFSLGIIAGIIRSEIRSDAPNAFSYLDKSYSSIDPFIGAIFSISSPKKRKRIPKSS